MAGNIFSISTTYAERVPARTRRLDAAVVEFLDDSYRLAWGQATRVRAALKKAGWPLTKSELEGVIRRYRIAYQMLNKKATKPTKLIVARRHTMAEGYTCLAADGFTTWLKVKRHLAKAPAAPSSAAKSRGDVVPLLENEQFVLLTRSDYDRIVGDWQRVNKFVTEIERRVWARRVH